MTRTLTLSTAMLAVLCTSTFAMGENAAEADTNGDGLLSVAEVQAVYPDVTAEQFAAMDLNADGGLDDAEVQSATEAGMMPAAPSDS